MIIKKYEGVVFGLDYDGSCVCHEYPKVGRDIGAQRVLHRIVDSGGLLILNTMRSGKELQDAVDWFAQNGLSLYGVGENPTQKEWTNSKKCYAQIYIDDAALGCPLVKGENGERNYVDWTAVEKLLFND